MKLVHKLTLSTTALASLTMMVGFASAAPVASGAAAWQAKTTVKVQAHSKFAPAGSISPAQMRHAYGLDQLQNGGAGQTVAIVDAYGSPTIADDLQVFSAQYGLPQANLTIAQPGGTPDIDTGWALETALDVEWVHALAPQANILLVEAKSAEGDDLMAAEDYATQHGAVVVSNSWGGGEFPEEVDYDAFFKHPGTVYVASSGDWGAGAYWPASSPYVLSVGGTNLLLDKKGNYGTETAWDAAGGAVSDFEPRPAYQSAWTGVVGTQRGIPDVAMDADPSTGVNVYTSADGNPTWYQVGGTSLSAPMWASVIALADEGRSTPLSSTQALTALYELAGKTGSKSYKANFNDVISGNNGNPALKGYDLVTGLGTPKAGTLIPNLTAAK
ncbi:MAG: S53 family peptidase [Tumebacillaceae bacterium]